MDSIKVLIVDDHPIMREGIRALLRIQQGIDIVGEASDGKEVFAQTLELAPDVVIMDIAMPGMDGLEVTRRIKKQNLKSKILILTQYDNKEFILSAFKAGASGYLPKRALGTDLVTAIRTIFRGDSFLYPPAASALFDYYQHNQAENTDPYDLLTSRQREILKLIAEGHTCKEIAEIMFISPKTIYGHRAGIMKKLGLRNRTELIKYLARKGLLNLAA